MTALNKQAYRADGGDIGIGRLKDIADNAYGDEEKRWLAQRVLALLDELEATQKTSEARRNAILRTHNMFQKQRSRAEAAEKRIAELEAKHQTSDKLQDSAFRHGLQHGFSYGQTNDQAGYEQCLKSYSSIGKDNG